MRDFFWESTQRARKEHFCYFCCNWIQPGEIYTRKIWAPRRGSFHVMCEHDTPGCPPNIGEEMVEEQMREEPMALGVPITFEIKVKEVLVVLANGQTVVEHQSEMVPVVGNVELLVADNDDEEIVF